MEFGEGKLERQTWTNGEFSSVVLMDAISWPSLRPFVCLHTTLLYSALVICIFSSSKKGLKHQQKNLFTPCGF